MQEKYQCHICIEIANKPVVTPCGHLFCWACIYHWLRSNQEYLTCPICKSGLDMSSLRPLLTPFDPPEKMENGVPPRPKTFFKQKIQMNQQRGLPKSIARIGMNLQRGVLLAGYGLLPSMVLSLFNHSKFPEREEDTFGDSIQQQSYFKVLRILQFLMIIMFMVMFFVL